MGEADPSLVKFVENQQREALSSHWEQNNCYNCRVGFVLPGGVPLKSISCLCSFFGTAFYVGRSGIKSNQLVNIETAGRVEFLGSVLGSRQGSRMTFPKLLEQGLPKPANYGQYIPLLNRTDVECKT